MHTAAINQAIRDHGAKTVYDAANRRLAGDGGKALAAVGLTAPFLPDAFAIQSAAYAQLGDAAKVIDYAKAQADLDGVRRDE